MMTNEEAKRNLVYAKRWRDKPDDEALEIAIKALEQTDILDNIRAEIESQRKEVSNKNSENDKLQAYYYGLNDGLKDARDILDKYKVEVRNKEL